MSTNKPKPWERPIRLRRAEGVRARRRVLILCEDSKSARFYFEAFPVDRARAIVETVGTGLNTDHLLEEAIDRKQQARARNDPFNEVWCVFDRDAFPLKNYARAFDLAGANGIRVAWSNEAFELWYLLHFNYHDTGISRHEYGERLSASMGTRYDKADRGIYGRLAPHQSKAIGNAQRLARHWNELGVRRPERENPSTNVHQLVAFLNDLCDLGPAEVEG